MTEAQLKQNLSSAVNAALGYSLEVPKDEETQEALNVLSERLPSIPPKKLFRAIMSGENAPYSPKELDEQYESAQNARDEAQWERAMGMFLLMCLDNLNESEISPVELNPSLRDPER